MTVTTVPPFDAGAAGPEYTYVRVADHLAARIAAGEFPPDSMLPGERALALYYGVALGTVRRAVDELTDRGLVVVLASKGTFVTRKGKG
jgi:DNA-binding GntR family transcriptional regulator